MSRQDNEANTHDPAYEHWMDIAPKKCSCGSTVTKDGNYYICADSGWFLG